MHGHTNVKFEKFLKNHSLYKQLVLGGEEEGGGGGNCKTYKFCIDFFSVPEPSRLMKKLSVK
jgi:hypothetical protein